MCMHAIEFLYSINWKMDHNWINVSCVAKKYENGVKFWNLFNQIDQI